MNYNTVEEVWKDIEGYEGLYEVSSFGRVRNSKSKRIRKQNLVKGYLMIGLSKDGKKKVFSVHRLVALNFIPNPEEKPEVNHLDEIKTNNNVDNLAWATSKENSNWGTRNKKISEYVIANPVRIKGRKNNNRGGGKFKPIYQIDANTGEIVNRYDSVGEALVAMGSNPKSGSISSCLSEKGHRNTYKGYKWKYAN